MGETFTAAEVCAKLRAWEAVGGRLHMVVKSDLLGRLFYGGEKGPSQTPCPVHQGKWSGCHFHWPGAEWVSVRTGETRPAEVEPMLQEWWDAGCRCATHRGSSCTTGWQPDEHCGCDTVAGPEET